MKEKLGSSILVIPWIGLCTTASVYFALLAKKTIENYIGEV